MRKERLKRIMEDHQKWLVRNGGERADFSGADLIYANLRGANLKEANLKEADLKEADLREADLRDADLEEADLRGANLRDADLEGANLRDANFRGANLEGTNLIATKLGENIIYCDYYQIHINKDYIQIGCKCFSFDEWMSLPDTLIVTMDGRTGLEWWRENKEIIRLQYEKLLKRLEKGKS